MELVIILIVGVIISITSKKFQKIIKSDLKVEKLGWRIQCMAFMSAAGTVAIVVNALALALQYIIPLFA